MARAFGSAVCVLSFLCARAAHGTVVDPEFEQTTVVAPASQAGTSGLAWAPDGSPRLFYTRQTGLIRVVQNGALLAKPFAIIKPVQTDSVETGVIGIAFDPRYLDNHYVYVFVTVSPTEQQIIRYTDVNNVGTDKTTIISGLPTRSVNHNGGAVGFGPDGKLYWAIGDLGNKTGAGADLSLISAKVARVNLDGSGPRDNPFYDGDGPNDDRIWARGFRNPFSFTWQPSTDRLWVNVTGAMYEQIFTPVAGDHAGWADYQNDQPEGYLPPTIVYRSARSDRWDITTEGASRSAGVATFTTTLPHGLRLGEKITISGVTDPSFNGDFFVAQTASPTTFSFAQAGPDAESGAGMAATLLIGGALTAGTFWDSSAVPAAYRGNFFFGDYNSGNIVRATLGADNVVTSVDLWATTDAQMIDLAVGPDGDLYYGTFDGGVHKLHHRAAAQGIVVSQLHTRVSEGSVGGFAVRLAQAPAGPVQVAVTRVSGDEDVSVKAGASLAFDQTSWSQPQFVTLAAAQDEDAAQDEATVQVSAVGLGPETVIVRVTEDDDAALVISPNHVSVSEGAEGGFELRLTGAPTRPLTIKCRVAVGDVSLTAGAELLFDATNWSELQAVTLRAPEDADTEDADATLEVDAAWLGKTEVPVAVTDDDSPGLGAAGAAGGPPQAEAGAPPDGQSAEAGSPATTASGGQPEVPSASGGEPVTGTEAPVVASSEGCGCSVPGGGAGSQGLLAALSAWFWARSRRRSRREARWRTSS